MPELRRLDALDVSAKRVLLRVDLNVPLQNGKILDDTRVSRIIPTIEALLERGASVVLLSHLGRPKGNKVAELSLRPLRDALAANLGEHEITFVEDIVGDDARAAAESLGRGSVLLLENLRFDPGEESNDPEFAQGLAQLGDAYVDDAFSCAHRAHASIDALAKMLPAVAGLEMAHELDVLETTLNAPERPLTAIIGGAKVSTKIGVLEALAKKVDALVISGGMANTFLSARGVNVGRSLCEYDQIATASAIEGTIAARDGRLILPSDVIVAHKLERDSASETVPAESVPPDSMILDIGPSSLADIELQIRASRTLVWNGPLGAFEFPPFNRGTIAIATSAAEQTSAGQLTSVAGGGETLAAINQAGVSGQFSYLSTAGGAFLEWLEGRALPGVEVLYG